MEPKQSLIPTTRPPLSSVSAFGLWVWFFFSPFWFASSLLYRRPLVVFVSVLAAISEPGSGCRSTLWINSWRKNFVSGLPVSWKRPWSNLCTRNTTGIAHRTGISSVFSVILSVFQCLVLILSIFCSYVPLECVMNLFCLKFSNDIWNCLYEFVCYMKFLIPSIINFTIIFVVVEALPVWFTLSKILAT